MAHNRSPSKIRSDVMASPLANFRGWQMHVGCVGRRCPKGRVYLVDALMVDRAEITVADLVAKMRCTACGGALRDVTLVAVEEVRRVPLWGDGVRW